MDNNQLNNSAVLKKRYNPLKDANFWVAFVLGSGPVIFLLIYKGFIFQSPVIINLIFLITWEVWIILRKGRKGSLLLGFLIAAGIAIISFFPIREIENKRQEKQIEQVKEKINQQIQLELEKMKNSSNAEQSKELINCPGPYRIIASDGNCKWSCSQGTMPGDSNECVCKPGYIETGKDSLGRRICEVVNK